MPPTPCPDENALSAWAVGASTIEEAKGIAEHVESCEACRTTFAAVVNAMQLDSTLRSGATPAGASRLLTEPSPVSEGELLLGKYQVEHTLGSGGMGVVVRARHVQLNTWVALKFIRADLAKDADVVSRFAREARAAVQLKTERVARVLDLGVLPSGVPFMVMEYLEGETLAARLQRSGTLGTEEAVKWTLEALQGLIEAHALGIVHRDLKPANLFIQRVNGRPESLKILDFGVAKSVHPDIEAGLEQTSQRMLVGSPAYMAPEQLTPGSSVDPRADLWAVGCTLWTLLAGAPPFSGNDLVEVAYKIRNAPLPAPPPSVPPAIAEVLARCLERDPAKRVSNAAELAALLERAVSYPTPGPVKNRRPVLWAASVAAAVALIAAGIAFRPASVKPPEPEPVAPPARPVAAMEQPVPPPEPPLTAPPSAKAETPPLKPAVVVNPSRPKAVAAPKADAGPAPVEDVFKDRL
ncbi:MAG: serine/threonine-protein kinase [Myxococcaceae bacterium]